METEFSITDVQSWIRASKTLASLIVKNALNREVTEKDIEYKQIEDNGNIKNFLILNDELIDIIFIYDNGPFKITLGNGIKLQDDIEIEGFKKFHQIAFYRDLNNEEDKTFFAEEYLDYATPKITYVFNPKALTNESLKSRFDKDFIVFNKILLASSYNEIKKIISESEILKDSFENKK